MEKSISSVSSTKTSAAALRSMSEVDNVFTSQLKPDVNKTRATPQRTRVTQTIAHKRKPDIDSNAMLPSRIAIVVFPRGN